MKTLFTLNNRELDLLLFPETNEEKILMDYFESQRMRKKLTISVINSDSAGIKEIRLGWRK